MVDCKKLVQNAAATICVGSCSSFGGIPAAAPNPTNAVSVSSLVPGAAIINLPGCPVNATNLTATIVHFMTFGKLPAVDRLGRPPRDRAEGSFGEPAGGHLSGGSHQVAGRSCPLSRSARDAESGAAYRQI